MSDNNPIQIQEEKPDQEKVEKHEESASVKVPPISFHPIAEKEFMRIKDLKIILYTNLVSYFIIFRVFISALGLISSSLHFIILTPILLFDFSGFYGARKLSLSLSVAYCMYLIIDVILKSAAILYFSINLALVSEEDLYTFYLKVLVICLFFLVFELGQIYLQIKFCQKITRLTPEKTFILERVIRGNTFPFCICCDFSQNNLE
jgi:hypothetical protein